MWKPNYVMWGIQRKTKDPKCSTAACTVREALANLAENLNMDDFRAVIPLGHGDPSIFPCFRTPLVVEEAIVNAVRSGKHNGYSPNLGLPSARSAVAEYLSRELPHKLSSDDVFITLGCLQAIEVIISALDRSGANVLFPRPGFSYYDVRAKLCGMDARFYDLLPEKNWEIDLDSLEGIVDDNTVAMVIINPGNPCGSVYTYRHLQKLAVTARKHGMIIIADETYAHITFGSTPFVPMAVFRSTVPVITLGSLSKRWAVPGWRLGWLAVHDNNDGVLTDSGLVACIKKILNVVSDPPTFIQAAVPEIIEKTKDDYFARTKSLLRQTSDLCYEELNGIFCLTCYGRPQGSMFIMVRIDVDMLDGVEDDSEFCMKLAKEESVIALPGSVMGMKNWVRLTFGVSPPILQEGLKRILSFCHNHRNHYS